ncbi:MAG: aspartyl protease family protein [Bacteroidia bacterium]|nr:aspartyl protease family protein [Bacteroidia bacterium]
MKKKLTLLLWITFCVGNMTSVHAGFSFTYDVDYVKIPVEIQHNIILIPVRINKSFEMNFILDTGVRTTILTETMVAGFLSLDTLETISVRGLGEGSVIQAALARDLSVSLPGLEGHGINLIILPEGVISYSGIFGKPVYGIIGFEVFRQFVVEINYTQKYVKLYNPFKYKPHRKSTAIPIEIRKAKPYVTATLTDHRGHNIKSQWLLDTGASQAVSLFDDDLPLPYPSVDAYLGMGLSGNVYGKLGRIQEFSLGEFSFQDVIAGYPEANSINMIDTVDTWYGNLGAEIISRFHVAFDYTRGYVYLRKNNLYKKEFFYNISGLELLTMGNNYDQYVISYVRPNSPAEEAGIEVNDQIVGINGFTADQLNIDELYGTLSRQNGKVVSLRLKRQEKIVKVKFRLLSEI